MEDREKERREKKGEARKRNENWGSNVDEKIRR